MNWWRQFTRKWNPIAGFFLLMFVLMVAGIIVGSNSETARSQRIHSIPTTSDRYCVNGWLVVHAAGGSMLYVYDKDQRLIACEADK